MNMQKITQIVTDLINGNITDFKNAIQKLNKLEFLNLIQEYSLLSGDNTNDCIIKFKRLL